MCSNSGRNFRIKLNLSRFFHDHRSLARIYISETIETIQDLQKKIESIFKLEKFYLLSENEFLPLLEDVRVLSNNDVVWVVPRKVSYSKTSCMPPKETEHHNHGCVSKSSKKRSIEAELFDVTPSKKKKHHDKNKTNSDHETNSEPTRKKSKKSKKSSKTKKNENCYKNVSLEKTAEFTSDNQNESLKMDDLIPVIHSHINSCSKSGVSQLTLSSPSSVNPFDFESNKSSCTGKLNNYKRYDPLPTVTSEYLANKKVNIVKIDVIKQEVSIGPIVDKKNASNSEKCTFSVDEDNTSIGSLRIGTDTSKNSSLFDERKRSVGSGFVKSLVEDIEKKLTPESDKCSVGSTGSAGVLESSLNISGEKVLKKYVPNPDIFTDNFDSLKSSSYFATGKLFSGSKSIDSVASAVREVDKEPDSEAELKMSPATTLELCKFQGWTGERTHEDSNLFINDLPSSLPFDGCALSPIPNDTPICSYLRKDIQLSDAVKTKPKPSNATSVADSEVSFKNQRCRPSLMKTVRKHSGIGPLLTSLRTGNSKKPETITENFDVDTPNIPEITEVDGNLQQELPDNESVVSVTSDSSHQNSGKRRRRVRKRKRKITSTSMDSSQLRTSIMVSQDVSIPKPTLILAKPQLHLRFANDGDDNNDKEDNCITLLSDGEENSLIVKKEMFPKTDIENAPLMNNMVPKVNDIVAFKVLKMDDKYRPHISEYIIGKIIEVNSTDKINSTDKSITFEIIDGMEQCVEPHGILTVDLEDSKTREQSNNIREFNWADLLQPKLLFP